MCEKRPGPRCNDGCKIRDKKLSAYKKVSSHSKDSHEYLTASLELLEAQSIYDSTPKGISELESKIAFEPTILLRKRLLIGKSTRRMQYEALNEHKNGRQEIIASLVNKVYKQFSKEEIFTIIDAARESYEKSIINNAANNISDLNYDLDALENRIFKKDKSTYITFLEKIKINSDSEDFKDLYNIEPPYDYIIQVYSSVGVAIKESEEQLNALFKNISVIQDSELGTVKKYFNLYKKDFLQNYSELKKEEQPNPPREWIEGFLPGNGLTKNESTTLIPRTPEVQYALYKLIIDYSAIPDYEKRASKMTFIDLEAGKIHLKELTRSGKSIHSGDYDEEKFIQYLDKNKINNTFVSASSEVDKAIKNNNLPVLFLPDITKIMFDLPSHDSKKLHDFFETKDSQELYAMIKKKALKTWNTKPSRVKTKK